MVGAVFTPKLSYVCDVINKETFLFCYLVKSFNSDYSLICHFVSYLSQWLIKCHDTYFIFHVIGAALIRERRLFQLQVKHWGECRENSELGKKKNKCVQLEPLYELRFKSFPTFKHENSQVGHGLICQAIWFWYLFISSTRTKVGCLFVNTQTGAAALIKSGAYSSSGT